MSYTSDIWLHPLQESWEMANEIFLCAGQIEKFIFHPVIFTVIQCP